MGMEPRNFNEQEHAIFRMGQDAALAFHSGSNLLHQDVFKAESADWRLYVGFDDVDEGVYLSVTFKRRWNKDGELANVMMPCGTAKKAIERAMRFIAQHPVAEPYCDVDY